MNAETEKREAVKLEIVDGLYELPSSKECDVSVVREAWITKFREKARRHWKHLIVEHRVVGHGIDEVREGAWVRFMRGKVWVDLKTGTCYLPSGQCMSTNRLRMVK